MEKRDVGGEFNSLKVNELNEINQKEENNVFIENGNTRVFCSEKNIATDFDKKTKQKRQNRSALRLLLSTFVAVCAVAAIVQTTFPIPIFSQIFYPSTSQSQNVSPTYSFASVSASSSKISYSLKIDNVQDFKSNTYCVMLLEEGNDREEYISSIPKSIKDAHKVIIHSSETKGNFDKYISVAGKGWIKSEKNYVVVLLKDEDIIKREIVSTKSYVSKLTFEGINPNVPLGSDGHYLFTWHDNDDGFDYRSLHVQVYIDDGLDYQYLYIELTNITNLPYTKDFTTMNNEGVNGQSSFAPKFRKEYPPQSLTFKVYCATDNPSRLNYSEEYSPDGVTQLYLIYAHEDVIIF